ncbi:MAG: hypothetical protein K1X92_00500 [Bacteroidia bacterium]|nr:hypothetical protein [Bacteroidia bacterium]
MKKIILSLCLLGSFLGVFAQDAIEAAVEMRKKEPPVNAIQLTLPGNYKNVSAVLDEKFKAATKSKGKNDKDLTVFSGVVFPEISGQTMDYFYRVDRAAKGDDLNSTITLFMSLGNNNFVKSDKYPQEVANAKNLLDKMKRATKIYELDIALKDQLKVVKDNEEKLVSLGDQQKALEKKIQEINDEIAKNKKAQGEQEKAIQAEKGKATAIESEIETLKSLQ